MQPRKESVSYWHHLESSEKEAIRSTELVGLNVLEIGGHKIEWQVHHR